MLERTLALWERIATMRGAGHYDEIPLRETPVEIDSFWDEGRIVLRLSDAALELYRAKGGKRQVESSVRNLPHSHPVRMMRTTLLTIA